MVVTGVDAVGRRPYSVIRACSRAASRVIQPCLSRAKTRSVPALRTLRGPERLQPASVETNCGFGSRLSGGPGLVAESFLDGFAKYVYCALIAWISLLGLAAADPGPPPQFGAIPFRGTARPPSGGKTSQALPIGMQAPSHYLDLESAADRARLADPAAADRSGPAWQDHPRRNGYSPTARQTRVVGGDARKKPHPRSAASVAELRWDWTASGWQRQGHQLTGASPFRHAP